MIAGCSSHHGEIGWLKQDAPEPGTYTIIRSIHGQASTYSLFGIQLGTKPIGLYEQARINLMKKVNLKPGRALVHRTVDEVNRSFPPTIELNLLEPALALVRVYSEKSIRFSADLAKIHSDTVP
jgi:hypothetical protein